MKKHLLLLFCLVSSLMALAESEIVNIQTDVKLSASSQAEANIYTIRLSNTNLYFSSPLKKWQMGDLRHIRYPPLRRNFS